MCPGNRVRCLSFPCAMRLPTSSHRCSSHALTHAWMAPRPYWLNEGAANFMGTLWDDHQHRRDQALGTLEAGRQALALEEPPSPGEGAGQPLAHATSPVYYRTKAAYILWMLRDLVGDDALAAALRASNGAAEQARLERRRRRSCSVLSGSLEGCRARQESQLALRRLDRRRPRPARPHHRQGLPQRRAIRQLACLRHHLQCWILPPPRCPSPCARQPTRPPSESSFPPAARLRRASSCRANPPRPR